MNGRKGRILALAGNVSIPPLYIAHALTCDPGPEIRSWLEYWTTHVDKREGPERKRSLFLTGPYGTGKTVAASAVLLALAEHYDTRTALFHTVPDLLDEIRDSYADSATVEERHGLDRARDATFLVLDDLGSERISGWVTEKLFQLINHRHSWQRWTIITSNLTLGELADHIGERTTWRIAEMCEVIPFTGPNLRAG